MFHFIFIYFFGYIIIWILKFKIIFHIYCSKGCHSETATESVIDNTVQKYLKLFILTDVHAYAVYFNKEENSIIVLEFLLY